MGTRGSLIIRRDKNEKEFYIHMDAYPDGVGIGIIDMVRSLDLNLLYDLLVSADNLSTDDDDPEEYYEYSLQKCIDMLRERKPYACFSPQPSFILDSLFCEYGYVLDLDERALEFYVGFQTVPQEGSRYGCAEVKGYYPCRLKAVFTFEYILRTETSEIITLMESAAEDETGEIQYFGSDTEKDADGNCAEVVAASEDQSMRQLVIVRGDLQISPGSLAAYVSRASMAFIADLLLKDSSDGGSDGNDAVDDIRVVLSSGIYRDWLSGGMINTICEASSRNHLIMAVTVAEMLGLREGTDFFLIRDCIDTESGAEEVDENCVGSTLICIGFRPLPDAVVQTISKGYRLLK